MRRAHYTKHLLVAHHQDKHQAYLFDVKNELKLCEVRSRENKMLNDQKITRIVGNRFDIALCRLSIWILYVCIYKCTESVDRRWQRAIGGTIVAVKVEPQKLKSQLFIWRLF